MRRGIEAFEHCTYMLAVWMWTMQGRMHGLLGVDSRWSEGLCMVVLM